MIFIRNVWNAVFFTCVFRKRWLYEVKPMYLYEEGTENGDMQWATKCCRGNNIMTFFLRVAYFDGGNLVLRQIPLLESHHG